jgi:hypothetical protein
MSDDFIDGLLSDLPVEELTDKRLGVHDDAVLATNVELTSNDWEGKTLYSLTAKFNIKDQDGEEAKVQTNINVPDSDAPSWAKQVLLAWLHAFRIVPFSSKNAPIVPATLPEEEKVEFIGKIAAAFNTKVGEAVGITVYENKQGFVNVRPNKPKVKK